MLFTSLPKLSLPAIDRVVWISCGECHKHASPCTASDLSRSSPAPTLSGNALTNTQCLTATPHTLSQLLHSGTLRLQLVFSFTTDANCAHHVLIKIDPRKTSPPAHPSPLSPTPSLHPTPVFPPQCLHRSCTRKTCQQTNLSANFTFQSRLPLLPNFHKVSK